MKCVCYVFGFLILVTGFLTWYLTFTTFGEPIGQVMNRLIMIPWKDTAILADRSQTMDYVQTLVVVCSAIENFERRQAIRKTWGRNQNSDKIVFLLGRSLNTTLEEKVGEEFKLHNDIIQEDFLDTYYNLTIKSIFMLKQFVEFYVNARFLLKADDDVVVELDNLSDFILGLKKKENILIGYRYDGVRPERDVKMKWFASYDSYPFGVYPSYLSGFCYFMDRVVAEKLFYFAQETGFFHLEDVFITGFVAERAGVPRIHADEFGVETKLGRNCDAGSLKFVAAGHRISPGELVQAWNQRDPLIGVCFVYTWL